MKGVGEKAEDLQINKWLRRSYQQLEQLTNLSRLANNHWNTRFYYASITSVTYLSNNFR